MDMDVLTRRILVLNIASTTTKQGLWEAFSPFGDIQMIRIKSRCEPRTGEKLSLGCGFVQFKSLLGSQNALGFRDPIRVDGRWLMIRRFQRRNWEAAFVRGIPRKTTPVHLRAVFARYGPTDVCLIREDNETGPGFAFVTFDTKEHRTEAVRNNRTIRLMGQNSIVLFARRGPRKVVLRRAPHERQLPNAAPQRPLPAAEDTDGPARSILVGNIASVTTGWGLWEAFAQFGDIQMVQIESRRESRTGEEVSLGRGFVEFLSFQSWQKALDFKDPIQLDGRKLTIRPIEPAPLRVPRCRPRGGRRGGLQWHY
jgi:RNA recognition motif-containing protein